AASRRSTANAAAGGASPQTTDRGRSGRPAGGGNQAGQRFQRLAVQAQAGGDGALDPTPQATEGVRSLLPPGFSLQNAESDAVAIAGSTNATNLDRGLMTSRLQMVNLGQLDAATGQFAQGFGPPGGAQFPGADGFGPRFGGPGGGGPGGPGRRGGFMLGGR